LADKLKGLIVFLAEHNQQKCCPDLRGLPVWEITEMENTTTTHQNLVAQGFNKIDWIPPMGSDVRLRAYAKVVYDDYGDWPETLVQVYISHLVAMEPQEYILEYSTSRCEPATALNILEWMADEKDLPAYVE
jgi:hypothetical protein